MPSRYTIKDLERLSGIKAHTLRIWEQRYSILTPNRTDTNIRYYTNSDLRKILNISMLNGNGSKISKIAKMEDDSIVAEVEKIVTAYKNENDQVDGLVISMVEYDELKFEKIVSNCIAHFGFEKTFENVLVPFLRHTGIMWRIGMINPAQEHFITNLIRQKLIVGIDNITTPKNISEKSFVFFLPDNELHELSLLYFYYLAKNRGFKCLYLGQTVPLEDIVKINLVMNVTHFVTVITSKMENTTIEKYLALLSEKLSNQTFLLSGAEIMKNEINLPDNYIKFAEANEFRNLLQL
jgi:MerR family transcriptional regulator, light-induced transcriptional regulator